MTTGDRVVLSERPAGRCRGRGMSLRLALRLLLAAGAPCILLSAPGCAAAGGGADGSEDHRPERLAECPVCRRNGDLACVEVRVRPSTPRLELGGTTYYFCSIECREAFARDAEATRTQER